MQNGYINQQQGQPQVQPIMKSYEHHERYSGAKNLAIAVLCWVMVGTIAPFMIIMIGMI